MRKHFVALESAQPPLENVISMEEEAVLLDEANTESAEVEQELTEAERIVEVSDALEDLAVIADDINEATPAEVALIENAGQMAVAGTDVTPEEVIPALSGGPVDEAGAPIPDPVTGAVLESYVGRKISTEGIRETAKNIWASIQKFLTSIWDKIVSFFNKIFDTLPRLQKSVKDMKEAVAAAKDLKSTGEKVNITSGVNALSIDYKPADAEPKLTTGMKNMSEVAKFTFGSYVDSTVSRGEIISKAISSFDVAKSGEAVTSLRAALKASKPVNIPVKGTAEKSRYAGFNVTYSAPLLGNVSLMEKQFNEAGNNSDLAALDRYRNSTIELVATSEHSPKGPSGFEMSPLTIGGMTNLLDDAEELLKVLAEYKGGAKSKAIAKARKDIEVASSKAEKEISKLKDDDAGKQAVIANYRSLLNFNLAYARWAQTPTMPVLKHSMSSVRAILYVVSKSLSTYKTDVKAAA